MPKSFLLATACFLAVAGAASAAQRYDIADLPDQTGLKIGNGEHTYLYSSSSTVNAHEVWLESMGPGLITIGSSGEPELGVASTFHFSILASPYGSVSGGEVEIVSAANATSGTTVFMDYFNMSRGGKLTVHSGVGSNDHEKNRLIIDATETGSASQNTFTIDIRKNAVVEMRNNHNDNGSNDIEYALAGGELYFADETVLATGVVRAVSGDSVLAVDGGLTFLRPNNHPADRNGLGLGLRIDAGADLTVVKSLGGNEYGDITFGNKATFDMQGGTLRAGTLRFGDYVLDASQSGTVILNRLEFDSLEDASGIDWHIRDEAAFTGVYTVKGLGNVYGGITMAAGSVLAADGDADTAISLGVSGGNRLLVDGGTVRAAAGREFAIRNAALVLASAPSGAILDASVGRLDLSESALVIDADASSVMTFDATQGITAKTYMHRSGVVEAHGGGGSFAVTGQAVIGGGEGEAVYRAVSDAGHFAEGLEVAANGVLAGGGGSVALSGNLLLSGGGALDGTAGRVNVSNASGQAVLRVTGQHNRLRGEVDAAMDVLVASDGVGLELDGGVLRAREFVIERGTVSVGSNASTIHGDGVFRVMAEAELQSRAAGLTLSGYDSVAIDGVYTAGWDGSGVAGLHADSSIRLGENASIGFTDEALKNIRPGGNDVVMTVSGPGSIIEAAGPLSNSSMFGTVGMGLVDGKLAVTSVDNRVSGSYEAGDIARAVDNMRSLWDGGKIGDDLGYLVYAASVQPQRLAAIQGNKAGAKNEAMFQAVANPAGKAMGKETLEYLNGATVTGVVETALHSGGAVLGHIGKRTKSLDRELAAMASDEAVASVVLNHEPANRVWADGVQLWDDMEEQNGFSGYEYNALGFVVGYDRVLSDAVALGASFAYAAGDYMDRGALAHDSGIDSYAVSVYGAYRHESGWHGSLAAGYLWADNAINELRRDPEAGGASWARSDFGAGVWMLGIDAGFDYNPTEYLTVTPSAGLAYLNARAENHDARLGGVSTQRVRDVTSDALFAPIRVAARYDLPCADEGRLSLTASLGYTFNLIKSRVSGMVDYHGLSTAARAAVHSRDMPRHSYTAGLGMRFLYRHFDFGLEYDFTGGRGYSSHRVAGSVGTVF